MCACNCLESANLRPSRSFVTGHCMENILVFPSAEYTAHCSVIESKRYCVCTERNRAPVHLKFATVKWKVQDSLVYSYYCTPLFTHSSMQPCELCNKVIPSATRARQVFCKSAELLSCLLFISITWNFLFSIVFVAAQCVFVLMQRFETGGGDLKWIYSNYTMAILPACDLYTSSVHLFMDWSANPEITLHDYTVEVGNTANIQRKHAVLSCSWDL